MLTWKTLGNSDIPLVFHLDLLTVIWRVFFFANIQKNYQIAAGFLPKLAVMVQNLSFGEIHAAIWQKFWMFKIDDIRNM